MTAELRATTPDDEPELVAFLARVFCVSPLSRFLESSFMRWKYWLPREDWAAPRGYVLERQGKIAAHAGIWPVELRTGAEVSRGAQLMDFAADPRALGWGARLVRQLAEKLDFIYGIGGTEKARRLLPALGFEKVQEAWVGARPLRPFRQVLIQSSFNWKTPARLARNVLWSAMPRHEVRRQCHLVSADLKQQGPIFTGCHRIARTNAFFRYLQMCPASRVSIYDAFMDGIAAGRIALSAPYEQARVLGVWMNNLTNSSTNDPSAANLRMLYSFAQKVAAPATEVTVLGSTDMGRELAISAGFRVRRTLPVFLLRTRGKLPELPVEFQMADSNDQGFLVDDPPGFAT